MKEQNNIDQFFKNRLADDTPADNGWNVPPMSILDNALESIEPESNDRRHLIWKSLLGVGLLVILATFYFVSLQMQTLNDEISNLKQQQTTILKGTSSADKRETEIQKVTKDFTQVDYEEESPELLVEKLKNDQSLKIKSTSASKQKNSELVANNNGQLKQQSVGMTNGSNNSDQRLDSKANTYYRSSLANSILTANRDVPTTLAPQSVPENITSLTLIPNRPSFLTHIDGLPSKSILFEIEEPASNKFSVYALSGLSFSNYQITDGENSNYDLSQFHNYCPGFQAEIGVSMELARRWSLFTSLEYGEWTNRSMFIQDVTYNSNNMVIDANGRRIYSDMLYVATPSSMSQNFMQFEFRSRDMEDGTSMLNKTIVEDSYQSLGLSFGMSFDFIKQSRFELAGYLAATARTILSASQNLNTELYDGSLMMGDNNMSYSIKSQLARRVYSATLGAKASYRLSSTIDLLVHVDYARDLSPINTQVVGNSQQTFRNRFFIGTGLGYRF